MALYGHEASVFGFYSYFFECQLCGFNLDLHSPNTCTLTLHQTFNVIIASLKVPVGGSIILLRTYIQGDFNAVVFQPVKHCLCVRYLSFHVCMRAYNEGCQKWSVLCLKGWKPFHPCLHILIKTWSIVPTVNSISIFHYFD